MHLHSLPLFNRIAEKLLHLLEELRAIHVYTNITKPGSGQPVVAGQQTIRIEFGTTVAGILYCLQVFKAPDYTNPITSVQLPLKSTTFDLPINIELNSSYMFKIVPCNPGDMIVHAGSTGVSSAIIE